jgi:hypothetical protein
MPLLIEETRADDSLLTAYQKGKSLCKEVDNDISKAINPYLKGSKQWEYWNFGWNSYWNPNWNKEA